GILDRANHIMHAFRQNRIREKNIPVIEQILTTLTNRYPEAEEFHVVFLEPGKEDESWRSLKFIPPEKLGQDARKLDGLRIGKMVEDSESADSLKRAWRSVEVIPQTTVYSAFDPDSPREKTRQYFFHTVFENSSTKLDSERDLVGLLIFSAGSRRFPSQNYYQELVEKHENKSTSTDSLFGKLNYHVNFEPLGAIAVSPEGSAPIALTRQFAESDRLFPNLTFSIIAPEAGTVFAPNYLQTSIILGFAAAALALLGLLMTVRAAQSEMRIARLKSDFLANISHELKTPLTAIRAFGDLIHSGRSNNMERIREYGGIIQTESDRLTGIINDILEMSRLERGLRRFQLKSGVLNETIRETVEVFRHSQRAKGFAFDVNFPNEPCKFAYDEGAVRQALLNLLSNAVKYSEKENGEKIEISLAVENDAAVIRVTDHGVGISAMDQKEIFKPFRRSDRESTQTKRGTGLGLAITKEIVEGHGGKIFVESEPRKGATFTIRIPAAKVIAAGKAKETPEARNSGTHFGYRG
ncbi:MAG: HAMP domain-containing histidine kinase, partial [Acidobacteria bacterium]|nr:HAMP domain-containing histidine kinase [Acidobacteriota bacterium]